METKWTPGPWKRGCGPDGNPLIFDSRPVGERDPEHGANLDLLDTAPLLYEALEMMVEMIEMRGFGRQAAIDTANAALAAARGEPQEVQGE